MLAPYQTQCENGAHPMRQHYGIATDTSGYAQSLSTCTFNVALERRRLSFLDSSLGPLIPELPSSSPSYCHRRYNILLSGTGLIDFRFSVF